MSGSNLCTIFSAHRNMRERGKSLHFWVLFLMKLQIVSDLHTEFYDMPLSVLKRIDFAPDLDFLALPGDIVVPCRQNGKIVQQVLDFLSTKARHVLYTTGNHEYYGGTRERTEFVLRSYMPKNFVWLQNSD